MATSIVSNSTAATFGNSPQKTGEPVDRLSIYSGKALEFDGVSDSISSNPDFLVAYTNSTAFTIACWVYIDNISSAYVITVLDKLGNSKYLGIHGSKLHFGGYLGSSSSDYSNIKGTKSDDDAPTGRFIRLVGTYDGSQASSGFKLYVDGELISQSAAESSIFSANVNSDICIGKINRSSSTRDFPGKISDWQLWDTVWSLADVTYDYLNPEKLITSQTITDDLVSNLKVWYPMNDTGVTNPQTVVFDAANTGGLETNLVTGVGTSGNWNNLTTADLTRGSATGFTLTSNADGSSNAYLSGNSGILSSNLIVGNYKISLDVTQTTPFGDEQSIRWYKTGSSVESLTLSAGSNVFYRSIDVANNNSQFFFNSNGAGNDITVSNFSIQKVKQGYHGTTTFLGDELLNANKRDFTNSGGELRTTGSIINSGAAKHHSYYEIVTQTDIDFTTYGAPDNYPGTVFCMNHADGSTVPTFDANNTVYAIDLGIATDYSGGDSSSKFGIAPNGDNKIYNMGPELFDAAAADGSDASYWTSGGNSGVAVDSGAIKITNDSNSLIRLRDSGALSADLEVGKVYRLTADLKVSSGASVNWYISGPNVFLVDGLTDNTFTRHTVFFTATSTTTDFLKVTAMSSGEEAFIDNLSLKETDILSIEYVDQADGSTMYLDGSKSELMSESLVSGRQYILSANYKVNTGSTTMLHYDGSANTSVTLNSTSYADASITFTTNSATTDFVRFGASAGTSEITTFNSISLKEVGIATGYTDANQQQYIPQTAFMDGCIKSIFNGSDTEIEIADAQLMTTAGTVSAWVFVKSGTADQAIVNKYNAGTGNREFRLTIESNEKPKWNVQSAIDSFDANTVIESGTALSTNTWNHIVGTFSANNPPKLYVNGILVVTASSNIDADGLGNGNSPIYLGRGINSSSVTDRVNAGTIIDEVSIFNTELDINEIVELYNDGLPLNSTKHSESNNLTGYWKNNNLESSGSWEDLSSNNNHGTINGTFNYIFFQQGVTANLCTQGYSNNIVHPSKGSLHLNGSTWVGAYEGDYADIPYDKDIEGDFSIEMWRKLTREFQSDDDGFILGANNTDFISIPNGVLSSGKLNTVYIRQQSGDNKTITMDSTTDVGGAFAVDSRPSVYEWFHCVLVRESGTYKVYVNGLDLNTGDREVGDSANDFTFKAIAKMTGSGNAATGFIDDLRIYDKALSIKEVKKNYNNTKSQHKN